LHGAILILSKAQYSGVAVYEMEVNNVAVMRRRSDSWLNATQILKVAGVEKGKRTKVLEREILSGEHEKVQGGYGKYQGTWISYKRGRDFCRSYGVEELLRPLLEYDMGSDGQAGAGQIDTPTKEQAMAAQRKHMMVSGMKERTSMATPNGTFFKNISASAANAIQALTKSRYESPGPRPGSGNKRHPPHMHKASFQPDSQEIEFPCGSQQSFASQGSFGINGQHGSFSANNNTPYFTKPTRPASGFDSEPPRKRVKSATSHYSQVNGHYDPMEETPTEPNESFAYGYVPEQDAALIGVRPLSQPEGTAAEEKKAQLISLFLDPNQVEYADHTSLELLGGEDLDLPIDDTAHTAMHWGATLARPSLLRTLIGKGANIFRVNLGGETALMKAVQTTNNFERNSFLELLELLGPTIETRDDRGRTVLHHIAISSSIRGKSAACRYYLESLLEFVVRQGSAPSSQQPSFNGENLVKNKPIGLARFMSDIVNAQDMSGDTALNIAARNYSKGIVQQLLEIGANPSIANTGGFKPTDFGITGDVDAVELPSSQNTLSSSQRTAAVNRVSDSSKELQTCKHSHFSFLPTFHLVLTSKTALATLITDTESSFRSELQARQSLVDQAQANLRDASTTLSAEMRKVEELQARYDARQDLQHRISNLRMQNDANRSHLATTGPPARPDVSVGDADSGLAVDLNQLPGALDAELTPEQEALLDSLPPPNILEARLRAYETHNRSLEEKTRALKGRSTKLEKKLRKLIALSTDAQESQVDAMLEPLRDAVESEGGEELDYTRLREFLRKVHTDS
jgi:regulatory protein SWI6